MKRMVAMLTVVALMVVMLAMSVAPAFAAKTEYNCRLSNSFDTSYDTIIPGTYPDRNGDGLYCVYTDHDSGLVSYADNHPVLRRR